MTLYYFTWFLGLVQTIRVTIRRIRPSWSDVPSH